jgi:hypothetical protein
MNSEIYDLLEDHKYNLAIKKIINKIVRLSSKCNVKEMLLSEKFPNESNFNNDYVLMNEEIIKLNTKIYFLKQLLFKQLTGKILE